MRVLIVDDEEPCVLLLQEILQRVDGLETITTTDPHLASELFLQHRPDLVLLDLHMGDTDGVELPMVVMSDDSEPGARQRVLEAGAHDLLRKPLEFTEVVLRTRNLLRTRSLHLNVESQRAALAEQVRQHDTEAIADSDRRREVTERIRSVLNRPSLRSGRRARGVVSLQW